MAEVGCLKDGHFQNLQVENFPTGGGLGGLASIDATPRTVAFTAQHNTTYILGDTGAATVVIALESPAVGAVINFILVTDLDDGGQWTIGTTVGDADFAIGSTLMAPNTTAISGSQVPQHGTVATSTHGLNVLTIIGSTNAGGGAGTTVKLTGVNEAGTLRWFVDAFECGAGNNTVVSETAFA
jgi:hypothetical protein